MVQYLADTAPVKYERIWNMPEAVIYTITFLVVFSPHRKMVKEKKLFTEFGQIK